MLSAFWHGFYPCWYHIMGMAYFLREMQLYGFKNKDALSKLPTWPLPKAITGKDEDYAYLKNSYKQLQEKLTFLPSLALDWLPLRFDPWMITTQVYYMICMNVAGIITQNIHHTKTWAGIKNTHFITFTAPVFAIWLFPMFVGLVRKRYSVEKKLR